MNVAILIDALFDEREFIYPYYRFIEAGFYVDIVSIQGKSVESKHGFIVKNSFSIKDIKNKTYDIIFIPGGYSPDRLRANREILNFVKNSYEKGSLISAICHGPWVLISSGILKGKKATGYFSIKDDIKNSQAVYIDQKVVEDGNIITATDPSALPLFMKKILTRFQ